MRTMTRAYQITGTVFFLFSAFIARESLELKFYTTLGPGPGFFPFWLSVIMCTLAAAMVYQATFQAPVPMPADFWASKVGYFRMAAVLVALAAATVMMERIGYRITMITFFIFLLFTLGKVNALVNIAITLGGSLGSFWLFNNMLKVPLPVGPLDGIFTAITEFLRISS